MFNQYPNAEFAPLNFWAQAGTLAVSLGSSLFGGGGCDAEPAKVRQVLGGARCGTIPYSLPEVEAAIRRAPQGVVTQLKQACEVKCWMVGQINSVRDLANASMIFWEGGEQKRAGDPCRVDSEEAVAKRALDALMRDYGGAAQVVGFATTGAGTGVEGDPVVFVPVPGIDPADGFRATVRAEVEDILEGVQDTLQAVILAGTSGAAQAATGAETGAESERERIAAGSIFGMDQTTVIIGGLALVAVLLAVR